MLLSQYLTFTKSTVNPHVSSSIRTKDITSEIHTTASSYCPFPERKIFQVCHKLDEEIKFFSFKEFQIIPLQFWSKSVCNTISFFIGKKDTLQWKITDCLSFCFLSINTSKIMNSAPYLLQQSRIIASCKSNKQTASARASVLEYHKKNSGERETQSVALDFS